MSSANLKGELERGAATIRNVADHASVSISTVSLALNSPNRVSPQTLERIFLAVRELNFMPKAEASVRARKGTRRIGVAAPFTAHGSFFDRLRGIISASEEDHFEVVVYNQQSAALHRHLVESLSLTRRLDGIILMATPMTEGLAQRLMHDGLTTVLIECGREGFSCVVIDDFEGGRLAGEYLARKGHSRCAFLGTTLPPGVPVETFPTSETARLDGFRSGLATADIRLSEQYVLAPHRFEATHDAISHLLDLRPPPSAIFAMADDVAIDVLSVARRRGLSVPDDVAVIGFDDREFAGAVGLTTIRQPLVESGRIAFKLLRDHLGPRVSGATTAVTLPVTLVERDTA